MKVFHEVRTYQSDFMVWHSSYENISFLAHWHKEIELIYIRSGSASITINDSNFTAYTGDLVLCDSGVIHYSNSHHMDNSLDFIVFDPSILNPFYQSSNFIQPYITKQQLEQYQLTDMIERLFSVVSYELKEKQAYYREIISSILKEVWYFLKRNIPKNPYPNKTTKHTAMLGDFQQLLSYIEDHYSNPITLDNLAKQMGFSSSHFSKIFKKSTGVNFIVYLNMVRVEQAEFFIQTTDKKFTEIAMNCGFNTIRTFNRVFKEITGYTPTQFSQLSEVDTYSCSHKKRKAIQKQIVQNDSITLIQN